MVTAKKNFNRIIMLVLVLIMALGTFAIENASAAHKEIGLVSESEYYAKYTDKNKYQATPYYRYASRTKETTTSGSSSMSGWTLDSKKQISSSTGGWQKTPINNSTKSDGNVETVVKVETKTGKKYYTYVCDDKTWFWLNNGGAHNNGTCKTKNYLSVYLSGSINASKDSDKAYACPASFSKSNSGGIGTILGMYYNSNAINSWASGKSVTYLWDANDSATFYRATTTKYQYNFSRWTDWSDWSDWSSTRRSTSDSLKEDTQVKYFIVNIEPEAQKISGTTSYNFKTGDPSFRLDCTTNGTGSLSYTSDNPDVASVDVQGNVTIGNAGTAKIKVLAAGNSDYYPATKTVSVKIAQRILKAQTISGQDSYILETDAKAFNLGCKTNGDGHITYSSSDPTIVSVDDSGRVSVNGIGSAAITVKASATLDYKSASKTINITINKKAQTISGSTNYSVTYGCDPIALNCSTNGDGALSYTSSKSSVFAVDGNGTVTVLGAGTAKITVKAAATATCKAASKTITITSKIAPITEVQAELKDNDTLLVTWGETSCDQYEIRYSKGNKKNWKTLYVEGEEDDLDEDSRTAEINLDDAGISKGSKYYITVVGVCDKSTSVAAGRSSVKATDSFRRVAKVTRVKAVRLDSKKIRVSWKKTASADGYNIYRLKSGEQMPEDKDEWEPYSTTKRAYFIDRRAKKGSRYTYWIKAYQKGGTEGEIEGQFSKNADVKA